MEIRHAAFLNILCASMAGTQAAVPAGLTAQDYHALVHLAAIHHVQPLFFEAAWSIPEARETLKQLAPAVRRQVMEQVLRTECFFALNGKLQAAGIRALVMKGIVCRSLYPMPDHRPSTDEDLLVSDEQFEACCALLEDFGMTTSDPADAFERAYHSSNMPLRIELHRQLFNPESQAYGHWNEAFADALDRGQALQLQGQRVLTMAHTDHMLYLLLHAFKHFLHSGFGIRQVCDIVLYANAYSDRIDWQYILDRCRGMRAEKFAAAIFGIGRTYLGLTVQFSWPVTAETEPLLEDILQAGVYGGATQARKQTSNVTLSAAAGKKRSGLTGALFPPASSLTGRYPYLKKYPWLLPWAWLCRLVTYRKHHRSDQTRYTVEIANQRLQLLRQYGVTEE